ncbi:MAG: LPS-assembly protein LptD [Chlorobi bacterium]|nr:LPS-assembly protein LptD [Chlorobiota bacterium]
MTLVPDSVKPVTDTVPGSGSRRVAFYAQESYRADTLKPKVSNVTRIEDRVTYSAEDSLNFDLDLRKAYLYGNSHVSYQDIDLTADYIEIDFNINEVYATGLPDSTGKIQGIPHFKQGGETFDSKEIRYNFNTKKGFVKQVITEQEGGYLHSEKTKRLPGGVIDIKNAKYTTCDAPDPHYYVALTKAKVIPGHEIISGPAYLVVADIPLPIALPFGFFPNKQTHASGILIPEYGEEKNRGFFLRNGGYYFAINDYFDVSLRGDLFSNGTWGLRVGSNYRKRYRFNGNFNLRYYKNVKGDLDLGTYSANRDYSFQWSHSQDPKANPTQTFRASVNLSSSSFDRNQSYEAASYLTNTKQSSISFSKRWPASPFNFTASLNHSQNSRTRDINLNLPKMALNMNRIYPLRGKNSTGNKWYENLEFSYNATLDNKIKTIDTLLFTSEVFKNMQSGFKHTMPLSINFKPMKNMNISPRIQYTGMLYTKMIEKYYRYDLDTLNMTYNSTLVEDTIHGFKYAHAITPSVSISLNPKIYGMFIFTSPNSRIEAIRHVMSPTISFSYVPDVTGIMPQYYRTITDTISGRETRYSIFEREMYGTPTLPGKSGVVNFSLNNTLEMKVRSTKDTVNDVKKVKLLESLNFGTNYNIFKDSLRWAPVSFSGRSSIFNNKVHMTFSGSLDPYALNDSGTVINQAAWNVNHQLARLTRFNVSLDFSIKGGKGGGSKSESQTAQRNLGMGSMSGIPPEAGGNVAAQPAMEENDFSYFHVPWDLRIRYNFNYSKPRFESKVTQTLNFSGNVRLTDKWRIGGNSGWDFLKKSLTYTSLNISRDLHCWEMRISWIPIGYHQSYTFLINVKASILKDLKYQKRKSWYDR